MGRRFGYVREAERGNKIVLDIITVLLGFSLRVLLIALIAWVILVALTYAVDDYRGCGDWWEVKRPIIGKFIKVVDWTGSLAGFILLASFVAFGLTCIAWLVAGGTIDLSTLNCYW